MLMEIIKQEDVIQKHDKKKYFESVLNLSQKTC